jgi:hypothetical protein
MVGSGIDRSRPTAVHKDHEVHDDHEDPLPIFVIIVVLVIIVGDPSVTDRLSW